MGPLLSKAPQDDDSDIEDELELYKTGSNTDFILEWVKRRDSKDVEVESEKRRFRVHTRILSARSDIFKLLIKESKTNKLLIDDITAEALEIILHYMYSGKIPDMKKDMKIMVEVYSAADKYCIEGLKRKCATLIKNNLNRSNIPDALVYSDDHKATYVRDLAVTYLQGDKSYLKSKKWNEFAELYPEIANEAILDVE